MSNFEVTEPIPRSRITLGVLAYWGCKRRKQALFFWRYAIAESVPEVPKILSASTGA